MKHKLISAKVIADSVCPQGVRMTTMEIEYPRFILAELNTHRMLSKNSASSRAIPVKAMHEFIKDNPAMPVSWGKNQPGMKANEQVGSAVATEAEQIWNRAKDDALHWADALAHKLAIHKQIANRITEPWMTMKTVISGTEWNNFFHLRNHADAQPEIKALAEAMTVAYTTHLPVPLKPGQWHLPYITIAEYVPTGELQYLNNNFDPISLEDAKIISASCCAQVSYRKNDDSFDKAKKIYDQLILSEPVHASPIEHQATPMDIDSMCRFEPDTWQPGVSHVSANSDLWSGNLRGWIQHRKLIQNEAVW
jgi:thymidylate synthase ThyX